MVQRGFARTRTLQLLALAALVAVSACTLTSAPSIRVMSFNIRYDNPADGENAWPHRAQQVADLILRHETDVVGVQEALAGQLDDLESHLVGFGWVGVGRDDGGRRGEFAPILYREERLELIDWGVFWLSKRPEIPGEPGWDGACRRIATWARMRDRRQGAEFVLLNTHFDHVGVRARQEAAALIVQRLERLASGRPAILTGDLNCLPDSAPVAKLLSWGLRDAHEVSASPPVGPTWSFHGFTGEGEPGRRIDYVLVGPDIDVLSHAVLKDNQGGRYPSDHLPVLVEIRVAR